MDNFGHKVRAKRLATGRSLRSLAQEIGVSHQMLYFLEGGQCLGGEAAQKVADYFGIVISDRPQRKIKRLNVAPKTTGGMIYARRVELGESRKKFSQMVGISTGRLRRLELNLDSPDPTERRQLVQLGGVLFPAKLIGSD
jgi:transcriptional regulator with XRE-family HTH domain